LAGFAILGLEFSSGCRNKTRQISPRNRQTCRDFRFVSRILGKTGKNIGIFGADRVGAVTARKIRRAVFSAIE
jgi:hypothetical protein